MTESELDMRLETESTMPSLQQERYTTMTQKTLMGWS